MSHSGLARAECGEAAQGLRTSVDSSGAGHRGVAIPGNHNQNKEGAKRCPELYYRDAYYLAYAAHSADVDLHNPFGYQTAPSGERRVFNTGATYKIMSEEDFLELRRLADGMEGWTLRGEDKKSMPAIAGRPGTIYVWDRPPLDPAVTSFNMVKVFAVFEGIEPWVLYDTIHDCVYRWEWDSNMLEGYNVCNLDLCNDIGYYAAKSPSSVLQCRDFLNQRAWRNVDGREFLVMNRSRPHALCPPKKGFTRAVSICSGYFIRPHGAGSCSLTYLAQTDPKGSIPVWIVNKIITGQVPKTVANIAKVGRAYWDWKQQSSHALHRPWVVPPTPWSGPQPDETHNWVARRTGQPTPERGPAAPPHWYNGTPAMQWWTEGGPLQRKPSTLRKVDEESQHGSETISEYWEATFQSCLASDDEEEDSVEDPEEIARAPLWDPSGRDHSLQCKKGAAEDPEAYYRAAYYMAYLAGAKRGRDPKNPFGYCFGPDGSYQVENAGRRYKIMTESDFLELRELCDSTDHWTLRSEDRRTMPSITGHPGVVFVWDRPPPDPSVTHFNMVKAFAVIEGLEPWVLYDTLHDCVYRWEWDTNMLEGYNVCNLDLHNDIGYYAAKSPSSLVQSRDFCNQRAWRNVDGKEFIIMNRSRPHPSCPEHKGFTRASSICSGFLIRAHGADACSITYVAQVDLKGKIPAWLINMLVTQQVPRTISTMAKVGREYAQWKQSSSHATHRPWCVPPQPWHEPQRDELPRWVAHHDPALAPVGEPAAAPDEWYGGTPALEWWHPGAPLGPSGRRGKSAASDPAAEGDAEAATRLAALPAAAEVFHPRDPSWSPTPRHGQPHSVPDAATPLMQPRRGSAAESQPCCGRCCSVQ